ncbi:MAG: hypothetical protein KDI65_00395, partial [Alphaproteobacteria bacterium]|nr:hypothetical protein [Alphaproteobacteria bacterium]
HGTPNIYCRCFFHILLIFRMAVKILVKALSAGFTGTFVCLWGVGIGIVGFYRVSLLVYL